MFTRAADLHRVALHEHDVVAVTDEIYEHIRYEASTSRRRCPAWPTERDDLRREQDVSVTGWRVGWIDAARAHRRIRKCTTSSRSRACAPAGGVAAGLSLGGLLRLSHTSTQASRSLVARSRRLASRRADPGAYYVLCDITPFGLYDDVAFARWLVSESAWRRPALPSINPRWKHLIRFTFFKTHDVLAAAAERLAKTGEMAARRRSS